MSKTDIISKINKQYQIIFDSVPEWIDPQTIYISFNQMEKTMNTCSLILTTDGIRYLACAFNDSNQSKHLRKNLVGKLILNPENQNIEPEKYKIKHCLIPSNTRIKTQLIYTDSKYREKHFPTVELKLNQNNGIQYIDYTLHRDNFTKIEPDYIKYLNQSYYTVSNIPNWLLIGDLYDFFHKKMLNLFEMDNLELSIIISDVGEIWLGIISNQEFRDYLLINPIQITNPSDESEVYQLKLSGYKIPSNTWIQTQLIFNGKNMIEKHFPGRVRFIKKHNWEKIQSYVEASLNNQLQELHEYNIIPKKEDNLIISNETSNETKVETDTKVDIDPEPVVSDGTNIPCDSKLIFETHKTSKNLFSDEPKMTFKSRPKPNIKIKTDVNRRVKFTNTKFDWIEFLTKITFFLIVLFIGYLIIKYVFF